VGHYSETDVREPARAFTAWRAVDQGVEIAADLHDDGSKFDFGWSAFAVLFGVTSGFAFNAF
jgi:hypothetical protein